MKAKLELGPTGVRSLVALCSYVAQHGNVAEDARTLAQVFIAYADAVQDPEQTESSERVLRMRRALRELKLARGGGGAPSSPGTPVNSPDS